jgi:hypothetical protein
LARSSSCTQPGFRPPSTEAVKTIDDSFVGAKDRDLVERGSILGEFLEHESSESNSANLVAAPMHDTGTGEVDYLLPDSPYGNA